MDEEKRRQYWLALAAAREAMAHAYALEAVAADASDGVFPDDFARENGAHLRKMQQSYMQMAVNCRAVAAGFDFGVAG